ncbi:hypothetical protein B7P43_G00571 [Cryptotermes secundus]|uniref:Tc1-like transposase DDE domain-containing protein n=1 Tax=Cryptotermes secundus TaxID=105785 RepID=A0A2J7R5A8_9NEOP|nr:hypothetical protein B7P43_G00571 [Cryptotermes secundus]
MTVSSRSSRGLQGIFIALQNSSKVGKTFNEGRQNVADTHRPGHPSVSEEVYALSMLLESDRCHTIHKLAQEPGLAHTAVLHILKECLGMRKIASQWVLHDLTEIQKWLRYNAARNHLERYEHEGEPFLCRMSIITLDETWAKSYEPQMKRQSNQWHHYGSPRKSKVYQNPNNVKVMDNAQPHAAQAVADLFDRWGLEVLYHPPYSPDLSPCDFDLIPKTKEPFCGIHFRTVPEILRAVDRSIRTINTTGAAKGSL